MIVFVSDLFAQDYPGGAELTTDAIIQEASVPLLCIRSKQLTPALLKKFKDKFWIFGNFADVPISLLIYASQNLQYSVLEYDYKFCKFRSPEKHEKAENECNCRLSPQGKTVSIFLAAATNVWFMSHGQRNYYCSLYPFLDKENVQVLSSVFDEQALEYFNSVDTTTKNNKWLIQKSPSWIKGTEDAIAYAVNNDLEYEIFENLSYEEMLAKFAKSKGFLTFPRGKDTCPRTAIEAKLLGCEIISNEYVQHRDEKWFSGPKEETMSYLRERTAIFWKKTLDNSNLRLPKSTDSEYKDSTHFKIIVPVYNSESWVRKCIKSILSQDYTSFECVICDDISTDNTYKLATQLAATDERFTAIQNTEKKFALKNIYDAIKMTNPSPQDVIVILDGDDWFSSHYVLSNLSRYYKTDNCWMTYGSFMESPTGLVGAEASDYPPDVIEQNTYREDTWRASHLKTFKHFLWNKIKTEDLIDEDGNFYEMTYDQAMMLPMLEMSGPRAKYIPEVNYIYNLSNPNAVNKTRAQKQHQLMLKIRAKKRYERLSNEDLT